MLPSQLGGNAQGAMEGGGGIGGHSPKPQALARGVNNLGALACVGNGQIDAFDRGFTHHG